MIYDYYRIFYYVAVYKSFSQAAKVLNNNQPNITRCMNILENELDCKLFLRSNRGIKLTSDGKRLYDHLSIAFEQISIAENEIKQKSELENGLVTIGTSETALHLVLLKKLEKFHEMHPHVRIRITNNTTPQAINALNNNLVDFAVVTSPLSDYKKLQKIKLMSFKEILISGKKYKNHLDNQVSLKDLSDIPLVSLSDGTSTRSMYEKYFLKYDLPFNPDMEVATADQIIPMIKHNLGIGFCPEAFAKKMIEDGEVFRIDIKEPEPQREIFILNKVNSLYNNAAKKLFDYIGLPNTK